MPKGDHLLSQRYSELHLNKLNTEEIPNKDNNTASCRQNQKEKSSQKSLNKQIDLPFQLLLRLS